MGLLKGRENTAIVLLYQKFTDAMRRLPIYCAPSASRNEGVVGRWGFARVDFCGCNQSVPHFAFDFVDRKSVALNPEFCRRVLKAVRRDVGSLNPRRVKPMLDAIVKRARCEARILHAATVAHKERRRRLNVLTPFKIRLNVACQFQRHVDRFVFRFLAFGLHEKHAVSGKFFQILDVGFDDFMRAHGGIEHEANDEIIAVILQFFRRNNREQFLHFGFGERAYRVARRTAVALDLLRRIFNEHALRHKVIKQPSKRGEVG